jgi:hypothetical protein
MPTGRGHGRGAALTLAAATSAEVAAGDLGRVVRHLEAARDALRLGELYPIHRRAPRRSGAKPRRCRIRTYQARPRSFFHTESNRRRRERLVHRKKVNIIVGLGGLGCAGVLLALGLVMTSNADFSERYVTSQLREQRITFKPTSALTEPERQKRCLVENAGKPLVTGKQAECYANDFIGLHVAQMAKGRSYAEVSQAHMALRTRVADAQKANDPALPDLQKQLAELSAQKNTMFEGQTMRGVLLTSYGFGTLGEKGAQAATAAYGASGAVALLGLAFLGRAVRTPKARTAAGAEAAPARAADVVPAL